MERKELCIISDIPSGSGGINGEGYTYGQLRHQPIIAEILQRITHPIARQMAEDCNERNRKDGFTMYKVDGEYCFEGLRVGPKVKIPSKEELLALLGNQPINAASIRNITYTLIRKELARLYTEHLYKKQQTSLETNLTALHTRTSLAISLWYLTGHINGSATMGMCQGS